MLTKEKERKVACVTFFEAYLGDICKWRPIFKLTYSLHQILAESTSSTYLVIQ